MPVPGGPLTTHSSSDADLAMTSSWLESLSRTVSSAAAPAESTSIWPE